LAGGRTPTNSLLRLFLSRRPTEVAIAAANTDCNGRSGADSRWRNHLEKRGISDRRPDIDHHGVIAVGLTLVMLSFECVESITRTAAKF
jgi:hypothetical protein